MRVTVLAIVLVTCLPAARGSAQSVPLSEAWTHLTVITNPSEASVRIRTVVPTYTPGMTVAPGPHYIEATHYHYRTLGRWVQLGTGERIVRLTLSPLMTERPSAIFLTSPDAVTRTSPQMHAAKHPRRVSLDGPQPVATNVAGISRVGRYSTHTTAARADQIDPLNCIIEGRFPSDVRMVGTAIEHWLKGSGYRLATGRVAHPALPALLELPLPNVHRALGPVTVRDGLRALAGRAWQLEVDPIHRQVSFTLAEPYNSTVFVVRTSGQALSQ